MKKNWTEIVNLAGQIHNRHQDPYMPLDENLESEMAKKVLLELGLDIDEILGKVNSIECCAANMRNESGVDREKSYFEIDNLCYDLRQMITNLKGE